ncbi:hypothetical protein HHL16_10855 [Pseudoflavitalea sp. G-6-1-2]|uniref:hypothetical protein n=1 Tax=Pseudoflavitalea sp. G-6-1-2 TaxID=2728841 RepID=UPI00146F2190|nr:hypothetical protein [Pseudoflavitalea sp. G-6-1-2]NML21376.1 hypothetical protein [Pseudoflavitalea sp. G-6-1-2]
MQLLSKDIITKDGEKKFQIRIMKDEAVGLFTAADNKNYLILDSADYWFDLIQTRKTPGLTKCKCKNEWFFVRFDYIPRKDTPDIKQVNVAISCTQCQLEKKAMSVDIDYSPTDQLIDEPLIFCEQPFLKYNLTSISSYWAHNDLKRFISFMAEELHFNMYCWFWRNADKKRYFEQVSQEKATEIITANHRYLDFYFSRSAPDFKIDQHKDGPYVKSDQWQTQEVIRLSGPNSIMYDDGKTALLFYTSYSTQFIDEGKVTDKSAEFTHDTTRIHQWFKQHFVEARGKDCFDNAEEHTKIFKDKFLKNKS